MALLQRLTYKQILLIKGVFFSLLLLVANYYFDYNIFYFFIYVGLLTIRYIFSYNLDNLKFCIFPIWHFIDFIDGTKYLRDEDVEDIYGTHRNTEEYRIKTSNLYAGTLVLSSFLSILIVGEFILNSLLDGIPYLYANKDLEWVAIFSWSLVGLVIISLVLFLLNIQSEVKKARVKDQLKS